MYYQDFFGDRLSGLGFGTMRLPLLANGEVDISQTEKMVELAFSGGINYFDTAWPYHSCKSEIIIGNILKNYPRESFYLADKFPGHQIMAQYDAKTIFETQLRKCSVEYFDYYLLHNVYEKSFETYIDSRWGILDYLIEQKRNGRIRHLGMSTHGSPDTIKRFLTEHVQEIDFVQIQLNYVDWTLQNAKEVVRFLKEMGKGIWVMEPLRGGKLCHMDDELKNEMNRLEPERSETELAFRWLQGIDGVKMILSGMSDLSQMKENLRYFENRQKLSPESEALLLSIADKWKNAIPCTGCRYCCDGCPAGLDIPHMISSYNSMSFGKAINSVMWIEMLPDNDKPSACLNCGQCTAMCPQKIDVPSILKKLDEQIAQVPTWASISSLRAKDAEKLENQAEGE